MKVVDKYDVGYRKPPEHSRFRKGVSGNPKGRRPIAEAEGSVANIESILKENVTVSVHGKSFEMSALEAMLQQLVSNVLQRNCVRSAIEFLKECEKYRILKRPDGSAQKPIAIPFETGRSWKQLAEEFADRNEPFLLPIPRKRRGAGGMDT